MFEMFFEVKKTEYIGDFLVSIPHKTSLNHFRHA